MSRIGPASARAWQGQNYCLGSERICFIAASGKCATRARGQPHDCVTGADFHELAAAIGGLAAAKGVSAVPTEANMRPRAANCNAKPTRPALPAWKRLFRGTDKSNLLLFFKKEVLLAFLFRCMAGPAVFLSKNAFFVCSMRGDVHKAAFCGVGTGRGGHCMTKTALVCGAGGFIGGHLVRRLKQEGFWVRGADLKFNEYSETEADDFTIGDLRQQDFCRAVVDRRFDEVYQLAADMGGAGYIFTGEHDADVMHNSATINLNMVDACHKRNISKVFYSSSACMYPEYNQLDPLNPKCSEDSAYPAAPDSEYGWEKLFSERLYLAFRRNYGMQTHVARYHNIFGPQGTWNGGKEKAPAAICRKVAMARNGDAIEIWGDGEQTRSFLYVDECIEGSTRLLRSGFAGPVNIGSEEMVTINQLVDMVAEIAGKRIDKNHIAGPTGVRGRNSDNRLIREKLDWAPQTRLRAGLERTYAWIEAQARRNVAPRLVA
jgi:nucleoside-diphosphate-sugar epimerase